MSEARVATTTVTAILSSAVPVTFIAGRDILRSPESLGEFVSLLFSIEIVEA